MKTSEAVDLLREGAEKAEKVAKLMKAAVRDMPSTDIRAGAIEASDDLLAWAARARS